MSSDYVMLIFLSKHFRKYLDDLKRDIDFGPDVRLKADKFPMGEPYGVFSNVKACFYYLTNWYRSSQIGRIIRDINKIVKPVEGAFGLTEEEKKAYYRRFHFINQNVFHIETAINFKNEYKTSYFIKVKHLLQIDKDGNIGEYEANPPVKGDIDMGKMFFIVEHTKSSFEAFETATEVLRSVKEWKTVHNNVYVSYLNRGCGNGSEPGIPNYIDGTCSTITRAVVDNMARDESGVITNDGKTISRTLAMEMGQPDEIGGMVGMFMSPADRARLYAAIPPHN